LEGSASPVSLDCFFYSQAPVKLRNQASFQPIVRSITSFKPYIISSSILRASRPNLRCYSHHNANATTAPPTTISTPFVTIALTAPAVLELELVVTTAAPAVLEPEVVAVLVAAVPLPELPGVVELTVPVGLTVPVELTLPVKVGLPLGAPVRITVPSGAVVPLPPSMETLSTRVTG
jgi:hypothetical protein